MLQYVHTHRDYCTGIMHKKCYTVTLDIECWDDLPIHKVDWAKAISLFPDEYIHSSICERELQDV